MATKKDNRLTVQQAAELLDVTPNRIRQMLIRGKLEGESLGKGHWLIQPAEVRDVRKKLELSREEKKLNRYRRLDETEAKIIREREERRKRIIGEEQRKRQEKKGLISIREAADMLKMPYLRVWYLVRGGEIPAKHFGSKHYWIDPSDVTSYGARVNGK